MCSTARPGSLRGWRVTFRWLAGVIWTICALLLFTVASAFPFDIGLVFSSSLELFLLLLGILGFTIVMLLVLLTIWCITLLPM